MRHGPSTAARKFPTCGRPCWRCQDPAWTKSLALEGALSAVCHQASGEDGAEQRQSRRFNLEPCKQRAPCKTEQAVERTATRLHYRELVKQVPSPLGLGLSLHMLLSRVQEIFDRYAVTSSRETSLRFHLFRAGLDPVPTARPDGPHLRTKVPSGRSARPERPGFACKRFRFNHRFQVSPGKKH